MAESKAHTYLYCIPSLIGKLTLRNSIVNRKGFTGPHLFHKIAQYLTNKIGQTDTGEGRGTNHDWWQCIARAAI